MNNRFFSFCLLIINLVAQAQPQPIIESFQSERDMPAVERILKQNYTLLAYESLGFKDGTTKAYIAGPNYITLVMRIDGQTVGFINYTVAKPNWVLSFFMKPRGFVHLMGVNEEQRGKGYGRMLLQHVLEEFRARDLKSALLCVKKENHIARSLYEKTGFTCMIPEANQQMVDDLLYEKVLTDPLTNKSKL